LGLWVGAVIILCVGEPPQHRQKVKPVKYEIIDETEVVAVRRGRKSTAPAELVEALRSLPAGKVVKLTEFAGDVDAEDYASHKVNASATIRSAGRSAGVKVAIVWHPTLGVPQVKVVTAKSKRK
jgi:hypothetical protein